MVGLSVRVDETSDFAAQVNCEAVCTEITKKHVFVISFQKIYFS